MLRKVAPVQADDRIALRINDAATVSGLGRGTLYKLISEGKLSDRKIGGRRLILRSDLMALLRDGERR